MDLCDEPVAASDDGLDAASICPALVEDPAQRSDLDSQVTVFDNGSAPHGGDDLVFRDQLAAPLKQERQDVERPRAEPHRNLSAVLAPPEQPTTAPVEPKPLENNGAG
jgi:hypothetical protein